MSAKQTLFIFHDFTIELLQEMETISRLLP